MNQPFPILTFPHDQEAERAVLGGIVLENQALSVVTELPLRRGDFFADAHNTIYAAMLALFSVGQPIDTVTLREKLGDQLPRVGGDEYLLRLTDTIPTVANIEAHAKIVIQKARVRAMMRAALSVLEESQKPIDNVADYLDRSAAIVASISEAQDSNIQEVWIGDLVADEFSDLMRRQAEKDFWAGIATGLSDLDNATAGLARGDLTIIAGRPGMGKTAFANSLKVSVLENDERLSVLSVDIEMQGKQIAQRALASKAGVDLRRIRTATFNHDEAGRLARAADAYRAMRMRVVDHSDMRLSQIARAARRIKREDPDFALIVIDYLGLMSAEGRYERRDQELAAITRGLKKLAKEVDVHIALLAQLNRNADKREGNRPQLSDLRESGAIEQDADNVFFVHRPYVYDPTADPTVAELLIRKQRMGPTCDVTMRWSPAFTRFEDFDPRSAQEALPL